MASPIAGNENFTNVENLVGQVKVLDVANLNATTLVSQTETVNQQALLPNVKPSLEGLTVNPVLGVAAPNYLPGINRTTYNGTTASDVILPAATVGTVVVHLQTVDPNNANAADLEFDCAGSDVFATGSVIETRSGAAATFDVSTEGETKLIFGPEAGGATTNLLTAGNMIYFWCTKAGEWHVAADLSTDVLATTGTFQFAA